MLRIFCTSFTDGVSLTSGSGDMLKDESIKRHLKWGGIYTYLMAKLTKLTATTTKNAHWQQGKRGIQRDTM